MIQRRGDLHARSKGTKRTHRCTEIIKNICCKGDLAFCQAPRVVRNVHTDLLRALIRSVASCVSRNATVITDNVCLAMMRNTCRVPRNASGRRDCVGSTSCQHAK